MATYSNLKKPEVEPAARDASPVTAVHPAWLSFIRYCRELRHGEIDQLKIQDGLPLLAEVTKKKVKFS